MSFEQPIQVPAESRGLFEMLFARLQQVPFDPKWINAQGQYTPAVESARLSSPIASVDPGTKGRLILIPTHRFGTVVFFDKWPERGVNSPVNATHAVGFDMIDYPFEMMAVSEDQVADDFDTTGEGVETEALTPVFVAVLNEVMNGTGNRVRFH